MTYAILAHNGKEWGHLWIDGQLAVYLDKHTAQKNMARVGAKYPHIDMCVQPFTVR